MYQMKKGGKPKMKKGGFPDLTGDGKVTKADVLKGRGVFKKGGVKKMQMGGGKTTAPSVPKPSIINPNPMDKSMTSPTMKKGGMVKSKKK